jgi:hypothetical protein
MFSLFNLSVLGSYLLNGIFSGNSHPVMHALSETGQARGPLRYPFTHDFVSRDSHYALIGGVDVKDNIVCCVACSSRPFYNSLNRRFFCETAH